MPGPKVAHRRPNRRRGTPPGGTAAGNTFRYTVSEKIATLCVCSTSVLTEVTMTLLGYTARIALKLRTDVSSLGSTPFKMPKTSADLAHS